MKVAIGSKYIDGPYKGKLIYKKYKKLLNRK